VEQKKVLKEGYLRSFSLLIDSAFSGKPQPFEFCDGVVLELYLADGELHWREVELKDAP